MSIDVRCLPYMPLHIERLRRSKAWLRCKRRPELAFYLMNLWMRAWHEVPAGSIEADDDVLADAAMCSPEEWERIKADVLHGWEEHDGRWHHHVVTELAADGMEKVEASRRRTEAARLARQQNRSSSATFSVTENATDDAAMNATASKEKKKGREDLSNADALGAEAPQAPAYTDARHELWAEGKPMLESLGMKAAQCGKMIGQWLKDTDDDCAGVLDAIRRAREARPQEVIPWITKALPTKANRNDRASRQARPDPRPSGTQRALAGLAQAASERPDSRLFAMDPGGPGFGPGAAGGGAADGRPSGLAPLRLID